METLHRIVTYEESFQYEEGLNAVLIVTEKFKYFLRKKDWLKIKKLPEEKMFDSILNLSKVQAYYIYDDTFYKLIATKGFSDRVSKIMRDKKIFPNAWKELESKMCYFEWNSHLFFDLDVQLISRAYVQDYLGGITNEYYDLNKARVILKELKEKGYVLSYKNEKIPYYNMTEENSEAISFIWLLPKDEYNKIYKELKKKEEFPSCRLKEYWDIWFKDSKLNNSSSQ